MDIKEVKINIPMPINVLSSVVVPNVVPVGAGHSRTSEQHFNEITPIEDTNSPTNEANKSQEQPQEHSQEQPQEHATE
ncbi:hypothetical protein Dimus_025043, partial [Dionaea muscipula]